MGLQLEEQKVSIKSDARAPTSSKVLALHERRNALRRKIQKFRELQGVYMPRAMLLLAEDPTAQTDIERIEDVRIALVFAMIIL
ncbi:hypothetical protein FKP32DRAFT_1672418 [Trametes sanguinea]|nr:hypothetical protein FKP32DRAFT_1672418 [Trametes sanguinea]